MANLAIWPITFKVPKNDLSQIQSGIDTSRDIITKFLIDSGFKKEEISYSAAKITDNATKVLYSQTKVQYKYIARVTVTVRSTKVKLVKSSIEKTVALVGKGILLAEQNWKNRLKFIYTKLNTIKPAMIAEATKNARNAAENFAKDSNSKVGKIRNASQGYFSISNRDDHSPEMKKIRVVTSQQYYLTD